MPQSFDPVTGKVNNPEGLKKKGFPIILVGVLAFIIIVIIAVFLIINLNPTKKVYSGISKTVTDFKKNNNLINALDYSNIVKDGEYTVKLDVKTELTKIGDISVYSEIAVGNNKLGASGYLDLSYIPIINYEASLDENQARLHLPIIDNYVFVYNYHENNEGYLMSLVDADLINDSLSQLYKSGTDNSSKEKIGTVLYNELKDDIKDIKFSSEGKSQYTINGKEHKCKGYSTVISKDKMGEITEEIMVIMNDYYGDLWDDADLENIVIGDKSLKERIENPNDVKITVYLYKDEPAAVVFDDGDDLISVKFEGGDFRAQNFTIEYNEEETFSYKGTLNDGIENVTIKKGNNFDLLYSYEISSGNLNVSMNRDYHEYDFDMKILQKEDELDVNIGIIDLGDTYFGCNMVLTKGSLISDISGEEINIGQCTEWELLTLVGEMKDLAGSMLGF